MQIKPFFDSYKEKSRTFVIKDDRGFKYDLVEFEGICPNTGGYAYSLLENGVKSEKIMVQQTDIRILSGWMVLSRELEKFTNGATAYEQTMYWREGHELIKLEVSGKELKEVYVGNNAYFPKENGVNTRFLVLK